MANEKISQLPAASSSSNGDLYPLVQGGVNYSITFTALQAALAGAITPGQLPTITLTGAVTGSGAAGTISTTLTNSAVTNSKLANMANNTIKGNVSGILEAPSDLSGAQVTAILSLFTSSTQGVVPASGGGITNFLRSDGTWAPATGEGVTTVGTIDTEGPSSDGATIIANTIYMQSASTTFPGLVNTGIQSFTGDKTFVASGDNTALVAQAGSTGQTADIFQIKQSFHSTVTSGFDNKGFLFFAQAITRASPPSLEHDQELGFFVDTNQLGLWNGSTWFQAVNGPTTSVTNGISVFTDTTGSMIQSTPVTIDGSGNIVTSGTISSGIITANIVGNVTGNLTGNVTGNVSGSSTSLTGPLIGDVTGTQGATVVSTVGGQTAAAIAAAAVAAAYQSHIIYVDTTSGNDANLGGPSTPLKTIGAAMTMIGSATSPSDFNNAATAYWVVEVAPGIYTENVSVPTRQIIEINLEAAQINGNVVQTLVDSVVTGTIAYTKLIFKGADLRASYTGASIPLTGINGNLTISGTNSNFYTAQLIQTGVSGNVIFNGDFPSGLFMTDSMVVGTISTTGSGGQLDLLASNADTSGSKAIGGINGNIVLDVLRNVRFDGPVITSSSIGGRWFNTSFSVSSSNNFTGSSANFSADANSITSFLAGVSSGNRGSVTFTYLDQAQGVGYIPTTPGDWSVVPTTVLAALDDLAASSGGGGVASLNSLTGALNIVAGSNITVTPSGTNITIASTGGGGGGVTGPGTSVVGDIATWNDTAGSVLKDSGIKIDGSGDIIGSGGNIVNMGQYYTSSSPPLIFGSPTYGFQISGGNSFSLFESGTQGFYFINGSGVTVATITAAGDIQVNAVGHGIQITEGANARAGVATLSAGTVAVSNTTVTANTRILLTVQTPGGVQGFLSAPISVGTGFTINSTSAAETSTVYWLLIEHI